jgi:hypothetical protein
MFWMAGDARIRHSAIHPVNRFGNLDKRFTRPDGSPKSRRIVRNRFVTIHRNSRQTDEMLCARQIPGSLSHMIFSQISGGKDVLAIFTKSWFGYQFRPARRPKKM